MAARLDVEINAKGARIGGKQAELALDGVHNSARGADSALRLFSKSLLITTALAVFAASIAKATHASVLFADSLAEVSTLLDDDLPRQMAQLSQAAKDQAIQFGSMPVDQAKSFYQVISAGAANAAEAIERQTAVNKLAVGGVTTAVTAVKGLTAIMDAYGDKAGSITDISDAFFVAMKKGKTDVGQLANSIGDVSLIADLAGLNVNQLFAAVSTLTKTMPSTSQAITGLKATLSAILGPSSEAATLAKKLGIEFGQVALDKEGLLGFLTKIIDVTKGDAKQLKTLLGGMEALTPALAIAANGGKNFNDIMSAMDKKLGETDKAFKKVSAAPGFVSKQLAALSTVILTDLGNSISAVLFPLLMGVIDSFETITDVATIAGAAMLVAFGPTLIAAIEIGYVYAMRKATAATATFTAVIAANPLGAIAVAITAGVTALIVFSDKISVAKDDTITLRDVFVTIWEQFKGSAKATADFLIDNWMRASRFIDDALFGNVKTSKITMTDIWKVTKKGLNIVIGLFVGAYETVKLNWSLLPGFFSSMIIKTVNVIIAGIESAINMSVNAVADFLESASKLAIKGINKLIALKNKIPFLDKTPLLIVPKFDDNEFKFNLGRIDDHFEGTATRIGENIAATWERAFSTDFIGDFITDFGNAVRETARIRQDAPLPGLPGGPPMPGDAPKKTPLPGSPAGLGGEEEGEIGLTFMEGYIGRLNEMVDATRSAAASMGEAFANVFGPGGTLQVSLANSAARAIVFGDNFEDSLRNIGKQIASQLLAKFIQTRLAMLSATSAAETMASTTSSAIITGNSASTASGIASQQALTASSVASSAQIATAAAPAAATTSIATAGGSAVSGQAAFAAAMVAMLALVAKANGMIEFAKGGTFTNNIVQSPTLFPIGKMGEAGPEAILPLSRNSSGQLGVIAARSPNGKGGSTVFAPVISVNVDRVEGDGEQAGGEVARQVKVQIDRAFSNFIRKQQRPGGQLNRQRAF